MQNCEGETKTHTKKHVVLDPQENPTEFQPTSFVCVCVSSGSWIYLVELGWDEVSNISHVVTITIQWNLRRLPNSIMVIDVIGEILLKRQWSVLFFICWEMLRIRMRFSI